MGPAGAGVAARLAYRELTRQPAFGVGLAAGVALVGLAPALAVFAIGRADALVLDLGASAMLSVGVFLAAVAGAAFADTLRDGTGALLVTHPVTPAGLVAGALAGSLVALAQAGLLLGVAVQWAVTNGPDRLHLGVVLGAGGAVVAAVAWGLRASLRREGFQGAALAAATCSFPLGLAVSRGLDPAGAWQAPATLLEPTALAAAALAVLAAGCFAALALPLATRVAGPGAAALTLAAFVAASLVRGPLSDALGPAAFLASALPDLQLFWVGDAAYRGAPVPGDYVAGVALYAALYAVGAAAVAAAALGGHELGRGAR